MGAPFAEVVIIGGGLAGLACAVTLSDRGIPVSLYESRPRLGGRASSFEDKQTQHLIDNCQHVSMGCCDEFNRFCEMTGIAPSFRREKQLYFVGPKISRPDHSSSNRADGQFKINVFSESSFLPTPLHLLPAFGRLSYLSFFEKIELARGLKKLARMQVDLDQEPTMAQWLADQGQSQNVINRFWNVVLVSALSESLERISLSHAQKVFVDGFLRARDHWQVIIPTVPLEQLYGDVILKRLEKQQAKIHLQTGVKRVQMTDGKVTGVTLRNGQEIACDRVVLAVPHQRVLSMLPDEFTGRDSLSKIEQIESAPITSVHLWFDREITELPHAVFVDCLSQWMFNRSRLMQHSSEEGFYYQIVISASHSLTSAARQGRTQDEIIAEVIEDLTRIWPETRNAQLNHSRMLTEHQAVFSVKPGIERLRPSQRTNVTGLYLAGDWTATGWPATMEGAVRSGLKAVEYLLEDLQQPESLFLPPSKTSILSKILFRL
ncbi:MAG: hydroxysqualene dehydroxylase HpnE [Planctomycetes bacterium]|nr:hydroxysqualene dehydroxylase HpnE [Planctomycetota bacterium]MCH9727155.1 hydroxysqualene dehydroxylase HpnE [Planctomycetota bacterium]MCH9778548.1 hydroxysqualene dehydroxylase HpnE [Planctomycetota bacterium]MCH9791140.1 hydroxysqualene dehydroxylase HpnE [Planctomycetota bacterium]